MASWLRDAVFYQVFPDRFASSSEVPKPGRLEPWDARPTRHGFKGGDLRGVRERLGYLQDLGVTALYLNPIFTATANHRYHTADYFNVDPMLGGNDAFARLLDACRERDMRVVIDGVFNHTGRAFPPFACVAENGDASPYRDWFLIERFPLNPYGRGRAGYAAWAGNSALPKLNTDNPEVREFLFSVAEHWLRVGIDGWRLDTPEQITTPGFWNQLRSRVKAVSPEAVLIGEVWKEPSEWLHPDGPFDSVLNYHVAGRLLCFVGQAELDRESTAGIEYPYGKPVSAASFASFLADLYGRFAPEVSQAWLNLDACHDTPRRATMLSGNARRIALAEVLRFALPGAPCIYYGEELSLPGPHDPGCRAGFPWATLDSTSQALRDLIRSLSQLRRQHVALRHGRFRVLGASGNMLCYTRTAGDSRVLCAVNVDDEPAELGLREDLGVVETVLGEGRAVGGTVTLGPTSFWLATLRS